MPRPLQALFAAPLLRRIGGQMDRHFFTSLLTAIIGFVAVAAIGVTFLENDKQSLARLAEGDDAVVVAESLGELRPLQLQHD